MRQLGCSQPTMIGRTGTWFALVALIVLLGCLPRSASARAAPGCSAGSRKLASKQAHSRHPEPFYVPANKSVFRQMATGMKVVTDKVTTHQYDAMYSKYFEVQHRRFQKLKLLEIGLGCNMNYGPGASAHLWRKYLPAADIWFAEYDKACVDKYKATLDGIGIAGVLTGDQANMEVLASWVEQSKGSFDVIIDDGGHTNNQIYNSFMHLFVHALKPGGIYFIEDLQVQQMKAWRGEGPIMQAVLSDWVQSLLQRRGVAPLNALDASKVQGAQPAADPAKFGLVEGAHVPQHKLPAGVKFINCMGEMCAIIKCTSDDPHCPEGFP